MGGVNLSVMGGNNSEADREGSERTVVDDEVAPPIVVENLVNNIKTGSKTPANDERIGQRLYLDTVRKEQQAKYLACLVKIGVGTNRIEHNQIKSRAEMRRDSGRQVGEILTEMRRKKADAEQDAKVARNLSNKWRRSMECI